MNDDEKYEDIDEYPNEYPFDDEEFEVDEEWAELDEISEWEFVDDDWR